jgi:hypothetical protein
MPQLSNLKYSCSYRNAPICWGFSAHPSMEKSGRRIWVAERVGFELTVRFVGAPVTYVLLAIAIQLMVAKSAAERKSDRVCSRVRISGIPHPYSAAYEIHFGSVA